MKTQVSKSDVMRRAWNIRLSPYHNTYQYKFSECLRRAWYVEKEEIVFREKEATLLAERERERAWRAKDTPERRAEREARIGRTCGAMMMEEEEAGGIRALIFGPVTTIILGKSN